MGSEILLINFYRNIKETLLLKPITPLDGLIKRERKYNMVRLRTHKGMRQFPRSLTQQCLCGETCNTAVYLHDGQHKI